MTLIASLLFGFLFGHYASDRTKAFRLFVPVWMAVLIIQTVLMVSLPGKDTVDVAYVILQTAFLAVGIGAVALGAKTHKPRQTTAV
jgi:endonuclease/exonuclease/phosphatase (EEP) superfamily protein YafD